MSAASAVTLLASALGRGDWGHAMAAELAQVSGGRSRRRFAAGCVGALLLSLPTIAWAALGAGLLSLAVVASALVRYPGLVTGIGTWGAVGFFVSVVIAYVGAAAGLSTRLAETRVLVGAVVAAAGIGCSWFAVGFSPSVHVPALASMTMLALGPGVAGAVGAWATRRGGRRTGVQCVGLASLLAGFVLFLLWAGTSVAFAGRPYDAGLLADYRASGAPDLATYAVSDSLGTGMMLLLLVPLVSVVAGVVGSTVAARPRQAGSSA